MSRILACQGGKYFELKGKTGENLLEILRRNGLELSAPCGGNGKCGKCRVEIESSAGRESVLACRYRIEDIILSARKHRLTASLEQELLMDARDKGKFVIY